METLVRNGGRGVRSVSSARYQSSGIRTCRVARNTIRRRSEGASVSLHSVVVFTVKCSWC